MREKSASEHWWLSSQRMKILKEIFSKKLADKAHSPRLQPRCAGPGPSGWAAHVRACVVFTFTPQHY